MEHTEDRNQSDRVRMAHQVGGSRAGEAERRKSQHSPSTSGEVHERELLSVLDARKSFGKVVGNILFGAAVRNDDVAGEDVITDEVMTNVDVLGTSVELMVARERDSSEIVC